MLVKKTHKMDRLAITRDLTTVAVSLGTESLFGFMFQCFCSEREENN